MKSVVINNVTYPLTSNPKHGIKRDVQSYQRSLLSELLKKYQKDVPFDPNKPINEALNAIFAFNPDEIHLTRNRDEESNLIATISLACNHVFHHGDFDELGEEDLAGIFEDCKKALGGDSSDFFLRCAGNISSMKSAQPVKTSQKVISPKT